MAWETQFEMAVQLKDLFIIAARELQEGRPFGPISATLLRRFSFGFLFGTREL
jgi:hypothetical protein